MSDLVRASFSIEKGLWEQLEKLVSESGYSNRSEYLRDLIRARIVEQAWEHDEQAVGTVTLLYDHHQRGLSERLTDLQHHHHDEVMVATHVHLSHDLCAEMIMVRGHAQSIRALADELGKQKGVLHASVSMSSTGQGLK